MFKKKLLRTNLVSNTKGVRAKLREGGGGVKRTKLSTVTHASEDKKPGSKERGAGEVKKY